MFFTLSKTYIMKGCLVFLKAFSASKCVYMMDYIDRFSCVGLSLHLQDEAHLIMVDEFFDVLLDSLCQYFIILHQCS